MRYVYGLAIQGKTYKGNKNCFWHQGIYDTKEEAIKMAKKLKIKRIMISKYKADNRYFCINNEIIEIKDPE